MKTWSRRWLTYYKITFVNGNGLVLYPVYQYARFTNVIRDPWVNDNNKDGVPSEVSSTGEETLDLLLDSEESASCTCSDDIPVKLKRSRRWLFCSHCQQNLPKFAFYSHKKFRTTEQEVVESDEESGDGLSIGDVESTTSAAVLEPTADHEGYTNPNLLAGSSAGSDIDWLEEEECWHVEVGSQSARPDMQYVRSSILIFL